MLQVSMFLYLYHYSHRVCQFSQCNIKQMQQIVHCTADLPIVWSGLHVTVNKKAFLCYMKFVWVIAIFLHCHYREAHLTCPCRHHFRDIKSISPMLPKPKCILLDKQLIFVIQLNLPEYCSCLKVPVKRKIIAAYSKAFKKYNRVAFFFLAYRFSFERY